MDCGNELLTNTWYNWNHVETGGGIHVSKLGSLDHLKLCVLNGTRFKSYAWLFMFKVDGDDEVRPLKDYDTVGIQYRNPTDNASGWLSRYGDYVKTTSSWHKATWFIVKHYDNGYYRISKAGIQAYLANRTSGTDTAGCKIQYLNPTADENKGDFIKIK